MATKSLSTMSAEILRFLAGFHSSVHAFETCRRVGFLAGKHRAAQQWIDQVLETSLGGIAPGQLGGIMRPFAHWKQPL